MTDMGKNFLAKIISEDKFLHVRRVECQDCLLGNVFSVIFRPMHINSVPCREALSRELLLAVRLWDTPQTGSARSHSSCREDLNFILLQQPQAGCYLVLTPSYSSKVVSSFLGTIVISPS
jgi:hypothetical protein